MERQADLWKNIKKKIETNAEITDEEALALFTRLEEIENRVYSLEKELFFPDD